MANPDNFSLGVTALLDELLGSDGDEGLDAGKAPSNPVAIPRLDLQGKTATSNACTAAKLANEVVAGSASDDTVVEDLPVSPALQRTADYCHEVDAYLAALGDWEGDSRRRMEALMKELEVELEHGNEEDAAHAAMLDDRMAQLRADLAELKQRELEARELRQRGAEVEAEISPRLAVATPRTLTIATGTASSFYASGLYSSKGLAFWCADVEAALAEPVSSDMLLHRQRQEKECPECVVPLPLPLRPAPADTGRSRAAPETIEGHLGMVQGALGAAQSRIQVSLGDLDRLLAECDAIQAQWTSRIREDVDQDAPPTQSPEWTSRAVIESGA